jgi:hypothetical protein
MAHLPFNEVVQVIREVIARHTGAQLPPIPPPPTIHAYGDVVLGEPVLLFDALPALYAGDGIFTRAPEPMEEYGQR